MSGVASVVHEAVVVGLVVRAFGRGILAAARFDNLHQPQEDGQHDEDSAQEEPHKSVIPRPASVEQCTHNVNTQADYDAQQAEPQAEEASVVAQKDGEMGAFISVDWHD